MANHTSYRWRPKPDALEAVVTSPKSSNFETTAKKILIMIKNIINEGRKLQSVSAGEN